MDLFSVANLRRAGLGLVTLGLAAVCLRLALHGLDWPSFETRLHTVDLRWLVLAVVFDVLSYAAQGLRWRLLLRGASLRQTTRAIYAGLFLNELIPMRPGEAVRAWLASRDLDRDVWSIAPTMVVERLMDGFWLVAALLAALAIAPLPRNLVRVSLLLAAGIGALLILVCLLSRTRFAFLRKVAAGFRNVRALLVSSCFLLAQGLAFWAVIRATHLPLGLTAACVVMVVVRIGTLIPGAPANIGTHQFATVLGLSVYGVSQPAAAAFSLVVFTVLTAPLLAIGFGACVSAGIRWPRTVLNAGPETSPLVRLRLSSAGQTRPN